MLALFHESMDYNEKKIYIAFVESDRPVPVGQITYKEVLSGSRLLTYDVTFEYLSSYDGPPLDPINLDYRTRGRFFPLPSCLQDYGLFRVFIDALPGPWGRRQLYREYPQTKKMNDLQLLDWLSTNGRVTGALAFFKKKFSDETPLSSMKDVDEVRVKSLRELAGLAVEFTQNQMKASIVHGGAKPKTTFHDVHGAVGRKGVHYIVKFNHPEDPCNTARIEHLAMELALECQIVSARSKVVKVSSAGQWVADLFLTERYDRFVDQTGKERRAHKLSAFALCDPEEVRTQDSGDYLDIVDIIKKVSAQPEKDVEQLFMRMILNVALNNTDDHLKNFEFILGEDGWKLSPAYDIVPNAHPYAHATSIAGVPNGGITDDFIGRVGEKFGVTLDQAMMLRDQIKSKISEVLTMAKKVGCSEKDIIYVEASMAQCGKRARNFGFGQDVRSRAIQPPRFL